MRSILRTMLLQMKNSFSRPTFQFVVIFQPIMISIITYMIYKDSGVESYLTYVVIGTGMMSLWSSIVFSSAGDIERERWMGNLEILGITRTPFNRIMYGKILGNTVLGVGSMVITFLWVTLVFGERLTVQHPLIFAVGFLLMIASLTGLAMIMAAFFTWSRNARGLMNCLEYPVYILTGMVFPLSVLSKFVLPLSWILSPTWAVKIFRFSISGDQAGTEVLVPLVVLTLLTAVYLWVGERLFRFVQAQTRHAGTLGVY